MELSIVLFIKIIFLYIFAPCLLLASIFSLIYTFIATYHNKKNKDMVKVTCEIMYCDKESKNRSIVGSDLLKCICIQEFDDLNIDYENDTYYFDDDGNIYKFTDGEDISWKVSSCNFKIGDIVYANDLNKIFIYDGSDLIEIGDNGYDNLKKKKSKKSSINYNDITDKDYKESDLPDNINEKLIKL